MPDRGLLERSRYSTGPIAVQSDGAHWALRGVRLAQVTFEVNREAALAHLPEDVSRPVPCYARLILVDAGVSPVGPFRLAALLVGGRFQLMPRNALVDALVDGPAEAIADTLGGQFRAGRVRIGREDGHLFGGVADSESQLAIIDLPALVAVDPTMLRWDPWLGQAGFDAVPGLVGYGIRPRATEAFLSKGACVATPADLSRGHTWRQLRNINTISACYIEGDVDLSLPQVQQLES